MLRYLMNFWKVVWNVSCTWLDLNENYIKGADYYCVKCYQSRQWTQLQGISKYIYTKIKLNPSVLNSNTCHRNKSEQQNET